MRRLFLTLAVFLVLVAPAAAQTVDVTAGVPLTLQADHDGLNTATYRVFLCSGSTTNCATQLGSDLPASIRNASGVVSTGIPAQARGIYTVQLAPVNVDGGFVKSPALVFRAVAPLPNAPSLPRILAVTVSADGTLGLKLLDTAAARELLQLPPLQ